MRVTLATLVVLLCAGCPGGTKAPPAPALPAPTGARAATGAAGPHDDWYPADISLPSGVEYPCEVTALPADLAGIPDDERGYVNHVYAVLIGVVMQKQVLLTTLAHGEDGAAAHEEYRSTLADAQARLRAEPVPDGLEPFHAEVLEALDLHGRFFAQAVPRSAQGATMEDIHGIPEGRAASGKLMGAWGKMQARYGGTWSADVKDSVYHHLCALDLF